MRALVFHHPKKVSVDTVEDPKIEKQDDIIVKVTSKFGCNIKKEASYESSKKN